MPRAGRGGRAGKAGPEKAEVGKAKTGKAKAGTAAWAGGVSYLLVVGLLIGGAPSASGTAHGVGALLAVSLLVDVARRAPLLALYLALFGSTVVVAGTPRATGPDLTVAFQGQFLGYMAVDAVLALVVATRTRRASVGGVGVTSVVQLLVIGLFARGDNLTVNAVIALLALCAACAAGLLGRERREHAEELRERQAALRAQEVAEAVTAERLRIARELHDMVAHSVGVIAIQAGVGSRVIETQPAEAREALRAIEATSRETLSGLRRTLVSLRRTARDATAGERSPLAPAPGVADLERLVAATADAGVRVDLRRSGTERPLPADIDLSVYRIVQEALTNVVRHAGAGRCRVSVGFGEEELSVEIVDDGCGGGGPVTPAQGFGLVGMRERVALLGGRLSAGPRPEGGFRVAARLPLPASGGVARAGGAMGV
ncbi:sensor histidine kinase, partial [Streptomyces sp. URMC 126]|uniref:sensor histidine kinase n=1 Tax=Streptomyces sp. URMC 126 TaxID=3423401 RepID=UPI003F1BD5CF